MAQALAALQYLVALAFVWLGLVTVRDWLRHRDASRAYLALAIGLLALVATLSRVGSLLGSTAQVAIMAASVTAFMAAGYALLLFRSSFIPLGLLARRIAFGASVTAVILEVGVISLPIGAAGRDWMTGVATLFLIAVWSACVGEPTVRFWLAAGGLPAVQRARLKALSAGYFAIVFILVVSGVAGAAGRSDLVQMLLQVIALVAVPFLYASFAPPGWLRRLWRAPEEDEYREALEELLLFSPDRSTLARRALDWAIRLVGADRAFIAEASGELLAARRIEPDEARRLLALAPTGDDRLIPMDGSHRQNAIAVPLRLDAGEGHLVVISGPFTPLFGSDEVTRLTQYGVGITAGLDRARVTERMAAVDRTKSDFLNMAAHELRSPLSVIRGYLSLFEEGVLGTLSPAGRRVVPVLSAKVREMNLLVQQMLDAARLEEGRLQLKRERLDLSEVAAEAVDLMRPLIDDRHPLVFEAPPSEVPVEADRDRLGTILGNLLDNAVKYSPRGGEVVCRVERQNGFARVAVQDRGLGISSDDVESLFTRFGRIVTPDTRTIGGTGLGLYLSRELARKHGGDITVDSRPGVGSTFTLIMPVATPAAGPPL